MLNWDSLNEDFTVLPFYYASNIYRIKVTDCSVDLGKGTWNIELLVYKYISVGLTFMFVIRDGLLMMMTTSRAKVEDIRFHPCIALPSVRESHLITQITDIFGNFPDNFEEAKKNKRGRSSMNLLHSCTVYVIILSGLIGGL